MSDWFFDVLTGVETEFPATYFVVSAMDSAESWVYWISSLARLKAATLGSSIRQVRLAPKTLNLKDDLSYTVISC